MDILNGINLAFTMHNKIRIKYHKANGETSIRIVQPLFLFSYENREQDEYTYLMAFCELRGDYRVFRSDRILRLDHINQTFSVRKHMKLIQMPNLLRMQLSRFDATRIKMLRTIDSLASLSETECSRSSVSGNVFEVWPIEDEIAKSNDLRRDLDPLHSRLYSGDRGISKVSDKLFGRRARLSIRTIEGCLIMILVWFGLLFLLFVVSR